MGNYSLFFVCCVCISAPFADAQGDNLANEIPRVSLGSCAVAGICCVGRDSSCVVQKAKPNSIIEDLNDIPCYCDHACLTIGDCCSDFKSACRVQDCEVSGWGAWSRCDVDCGQGVMTRARTVILDSRHGGNACPSLVQKRGCRGTRCQQHPNNLDDTAIILPVEFSSKRKLNESLDITRNLRLRYPKNPAKEKSKPYCVQFEVIRSTRSCKGLENFANLQEETRVCVICERQAQRPHLEYKCAGTGSDGEHTRFSSLREPSCHGKWKHIRSDVNCNCDSGAQYIFV